MSNKMRVCLAIARQMDPMDQRHVALWTPYIYLGCMKYSIHISKTHCGNSRVTKKYGDS